MPFRFYGNSALSVKQLFFESFNTRSETQNAIKLSKWLVGEVERIRQAEHLWNDYQWILRKLGFSKVILSMQEKKEFTNIQEHKELEDAYIQIVCL